MPLKHPSFSGFSVTFPCWLVCLICFPPIRSRGADESWHICTALSGHLNLAQSALAGAAEQRPLLPAEGRWHAYRIILFSCRYKQGSFFHCAGCHLVGIVWHMHLPGNKYQLLSAMQRTGYCQYSALLI